MEESEGAAHDDCRFELEQEDHLHCSPHSGKKRKFQQEYLTLPLSKQKFRDRSCSSSVSSHGLSSGVTQVEYYETSEGSVICNERQYRGGSPRVSNRRYSEKLISCSPTSISSSEVDNCYSLCGRASSTMVSRSHGEVMVEGAYDDYVEEVPHASIEELMHYSDEVTSDLSLYSSTLRDNRLGSRKPTIDEEFEEYFSALIL